MPSFIDGQRGKLFVLLRRPSGGQIAGTVLIVPPFAEEMNKTRPMLTLVAEGLTNRGLAVVLPDLYGTGDSAGEFRDGNWLTWQDDLLRAEAWSDSQGCRVSRLLAVRLGCILAAELTPRLRSPIKQTVFWQPVLDGNRFMTQFLRLRVAASMMMDRKETVAGLRERIRGGENLEVAGYEVSQQLLSQLDSARLLPLLSDRLGHLHWMEIVRGDEAHLPGQTNQVAETARLALRELETHAVFGEPYWSSTEIVRLPALVERTIVALAAAA